MDRRIPKSKPVADVDPFYGLCCCRNKWYYCNMAFIQDSLVHSAIVGICWFLMNFERWRLFLGAARGIPVEGMHCLHSASF